jgi:hypothetical protein
MLQAPGWRIYVQWKGSVFGDSENSKNSKKSSPSSLFLRLFMFFLPFVLFLPSSSVFRKVAEKAPLHDQLRCTRFGPLLINHRHRSPPKKSVPAAALTQSRACRHSAALPTVRRLKTHPKRRL